MGRRKVLMSLAVAVALGGFFLTGAFSQQRAGGGAGAPGGGGQGRGRFDPAQMRQRMLDRIQEELAATEEEWKALSPRIGKVYDLSRQVGGGLDMRGMFRGRAPQAPEAPEQQLTPVEKALRELREAADNEAANPEEIRRKMTALRQAREKIRQELDKAQVELRTVLSVRQEAKLVLMGLLD